MNTLIENFEISYSLDGKDGEAILVVLKEDLMFIMIAEGFELSKTFVENADELKEMVTERKLLLEEAGFIQTSIGKLKKPKSWYEDELEKQFNSL